MSFEQRPLNSPKLPRAARPYTGRWSDYGTVIDPTKDGAGVEGIVVLNTRLPVVPANDPVAAFTESVMSKPIRGLLGVPPTTLTGPEALPLRVPTSVAMVKDAV
jgi:hypothetical protein